ncbi:hypothetical protein BZG36_03945 [Bifiguratus adelaidae]|uniref:protoporphyrinogen oxidase n=1 Tax=Bifiguratus adelaidae TaxID=1938954 RepID=A0A261XZY9_9FUNG|nr:hypothetical protein BZG36_03945 [Bifiguratus adelaidae]
MVLRRSVWVWRQGYRAYSDAAVRRATAPITETKTGLTSLPDPTFDTAWKPLERFTPCACEGEPEADFSPCASHPFPPVIGRKIDHTADMRTSKPISRHIVACVGHEGPEWSKAKVEAVKGGMIATVADIRKASIRHSREDGDRSLDALMKQFKQESTSIDAESMPVLMIGEDWMITVADRPRNSSKVQSSWPTADILILPDMLLYPSIDPSSSLAPLLHHIHSYPVSEAAPRLPAPSTTQLPSPVDLSAQGLETIILVCTHTQRDKRCGILGPLLISEFRDKLSQQGLLRDASNPQGKVEVWGTSHIGGHKFAGCVVVHQRTGGHLYGNIRPCQVPDVIERHVLNGKDVLMAARSVAVLGGGISGLTSAYYLSKLLPTATVTLLESTARCGGWVQSTHDAGLTLESGPRSLRPKGVSGIMALDLIRDLGLKDDLVAIPPTHPSSKHRYIYYKDTINKLPSSASGMLFGAPSIMKSVLRAGLTEMFTSPKAWTSIDDDESIYDFCKRRFNEHVATNLMGAMIHGIYAGDVQELSVRAAMPLLFKSELVFGSVVRGMLQGAGKMEGFRELGMQARAKGEDPEWFETMSKMSVVGFANGLETLTDRLRAACEQQGVCIRHNEPVEKVTIQHKDVKIETAKDTLRVDHVISALPSTTLDAILENHRLPHLSHNPSVDVVVVNLVYDTPHLVKYDGFGFLIPHPLSKTYIPVPGTLGVVFDSNAMPAHTPEEKKSTKVTVMLGGHLWDDCFITSIDQTHPDAALSKSLEAVEYFLGIEQTPALSATTLQKKCIPQYLVGHHGRLRQLHQALQEQMGHALSVTGNSYLGVSVPDCIKNARMLVEDLVARGALSKNPQEVITGLSAMAQDVDADELKDSIRITKGHGRIVARS